jgi:hypothetical protein
MKKAFNPSLFFLFFLLGCVKYYSFEEVVSQNQKLIADSIWMENNGSGDVIRVKVSNRSLDPVFIDWSNSMVKLGDAEKSKARVRPDYDIAMVENSAVFELQLPSSSYKTSSNPLYGSQRLILPEDIKTVPQKIYIGFMICTGPVQGNLRPSTCATGGSGWERQVVSSLVRLSPSMVIVE